MTKFILHGGMLRKPLPGNDQYFKEIVKGLALPAKVLGVYFARKPEEWPKLRAWDQQEFTKIAGPDLQVIEASPDNFQTQVREADAIHVWGGDEDLLEPAMRQIDDWPKVLQGKVCAGSSAGANVLARYYYGTDQGKLRQGLGILPIKVFCHYDQEHKKNLEALKKHGENLKTYILKEGEMTIINTAENE